MGDHSLGLPHSVMGEFLPCPLWISAARRQDDDTSVGLYENIGGGKASAVGESRIFVGRHPVKRWLGGCSRAGMGNMVRWSFKRLKSLLEGSPREGMEVSHGGSTPLAHGVPQGAPPASHCEWHASFAFPSGIPRAVFSLLVGFWSENLHCVDVYGGEGATLITLAFDVGRPPRATSPIPLPRTIISNAHTLLALRESHQEGGTRFPVLDTYPSEQAVQALRTLCVGARWGTRMGTPALLGGWGLPTGEVTLVWEGVGCVGMEWSHVTRLARMPPPHGSPGWQKLLMVAFLTSVLRVHTLAGREHGRLEGSCMYVHCDWDKELLEGPRLTVTLGPPRGDVGVGGDRTDAAHRLEELGKDLCPAVQVALLDLKSGKPLESILESLTSYTSPRWTVTPEEEAILRSLSIKGSG